MGSQSSLESDTRVKFKEGFFFCSPRLPKHIPEIDEIHSIVRAVNWEMEKRYKIYGKVLDYQTVYNRQFETEFSKLRWELDS